MVSDPGATAGADRLRPLNRPRPVTVVTDDRADTERSDPTGGDDLARPIALIERGRHRRVERVQDNWRIDDEWWREHAISRIYYRLLLDDGTLLTVYHDLETDQWFEQRS